MRIDFPIRTQKAIVDSMETEAADVATKAAAYVAVRKYFIYYIYYV